MIPPDRVGARRQLVGALGQARRRGDHAAVAEINGLLSQEAFQRIHRTLKAWEGRRDPVTGLTPRGLSDARWNGEDGGADGYPFLLLASHYLDPPTFPLWRESLAVERRLGGPLPRTIALDSGRLEESPLPRTLFAGLPMSLDGSRPVRIAVRRAP